VVRQQKSRRGEQVVPRLPARLLDPVPVVLAGTAVWLAGFAVALLAGLTAARPPAIVPLTCLAGWALGLIGLLIIWWQRSASRRGSRSAQRHTH
jgi:Protein of unknown function (DUF2530)